MIPWWKTEFGPDCIEAVSRAIDDRHISQGPVTREFEERLASVLNVPYVVCTTSGTTALTMALLAVGIGSGDEVIVPNRTWIATAHAVMMTGAKVRLVDVDDRGLLPLRSADGHIAIPVNLNGRMSSAWDLVEDSCQAFPAPPRGLAACYSFSTAKLVPTGQGGCVATRDEGFYKELKSLRTHDVEDAMVPQVLAWKRFGYNFRFTDVQAAIGLIQLSKMNERIARLYEIRGLYEGIPDYLEMLPCDGVPLYSEVIYAESEDLRAFLLAKGIEARPFYPSLDSAPYLESDHNFPNSRRFEHGLTLPSGPSQTDADIKRVLEVLHGYRG